MEVNVVFSLIAFLCFVSLAFIFSSLFTQHSGGKKKMARLKMEKKNMAQC